MNRQEKNTIAFSAIAGVIALLCHATIRYLGLDEEIYLLTINQENYNILQIYLFAIPGGLIIGIILGIFNVILNRFIFRWSFGKIVLCKVLVFTLIWVFLTLFLTFLVSKISNFKPGFSSFKLTSSFLFSMVFSGLFATFFIFFLQDISRMIGPKIIKNILLGKYHTPQEEDRVFLFLDLKSSTTIAEQLGNLKYSCFIQDCFYDLNQLLPYYDAEIYQYVGDEAVITWLYEKKLKTFPLDIFFAYQELLEKRSTYYQEKYAHIPRFKASLHSGMVVATEVGDIKREIAYHGDVVNTAARIQSVCNQYNSNLLISHSIKQHLPNSKEYKFCDLGFISLKGRKQKIKIYNVQKIKI